MVRAGKQGLGFIGLGTMGMRMARRLMDAGYIMTVFNRTRWKAEELACAGAQIAASPRELTQQADVVISCVTDDAALRQVMWGEQGALAGASPGSVFIETSSVYPSLSRMAADAVRQKGADMLDVAVSGSVTAAEQGNLVGLVGGDQSTFDKCSPILDRLGHCYLLGPNGSGATMKLAVNTLLGVGMQAIAEAVALAEKASLDRKQVLEVLAETALIAPAFKVMVDNALKDRYPSAFPLRLMHKDFGNILRMANELNVPMSATAASAQMCSLENARGLEEDFSAMIRAMRELTAAHKPVAEAKGLTAAD